MKHFLRVFLGLSLILHINIHGIPFSNYVRSADRYKGLMKTIHGHLQSGDINNVAIVIYLLHKLFKVPYSKIVKADLKTKQNTLLGKFASLAMTNDTIMESKPFSEYVLMANMCMSDLASINNLKITRDKNNVAILLYLLHALFGDKYKDLVAIDFITKQTALLGRLATLDKISKLESAPSRSSGADGDGEEKDDDSEIEAEKTEFNRITTTDQFKLLQPSDAQIQIGSTCGTHSIVNAWTIEQLLAEGKEITANNIFNRAISTVDSCGIDALVEPDVVLSRASSFIPDISTRTNFIGRINFLAHSPFYGYNDKYNIYISSPDGESASNLSDIRPIISSLSSQPPYIEHFVCNTGLHWILISILHKPGEQPVMYYIDSAGADIDIIRDHTPRRSFVLSLYENFVKP